MRYLLLLFLSFLQLASFSQQSALDSIAVKIQSYINKNGVKLENRSIDDWYWLACTNDSLILDSSVNFIHNVDFDKSKLVDSFFYQLVVVYDPIADTAIVDIFQGWNLGSTIFITYNLSGDFAGGIKKHSQELFSYIHNSGLTIPDSIEFRVYFNKEAPYNALYVESLNSSLSRLVLDYYNTIALKKYSPPIKNGRPYFSSHLFKYKDSDNRIYHEDYKEYDSLISSDESVYLLTDWRASDPLDGIVIFDRKKKMKDILTPAFFNQFNNEHHESICELVIQRGDVGGSNILKVSIVKR